MREKTTTTFPGVNMRDWINPHHIALITMWLLSTIIYTIMLVTGVRNIDNSYFERHAIQAAYVAVLLWYLGCSGSSISQLPEIRPIALLRWRLASWIPILGIGIVFVLTFISDEGINTLQNLMVLSLVPIIVVWHRELSLRLVIQSIVLAAIAFVAGQPMIENGVVSQAGILFTIFVVLFYIAGGLLFSHSRLGWIQLLAKQYIPMLRNLLWGCLLFVLLPTIMEWNRQRNLVQTIPCGYSLFAAAARAQKTPCARRPACSPLQRNHLRPRAWPNAGKIPDDRTTLWGFFCGYIRQACLGTRCGRTLHG